MSALSLFLLIGCAIAGVTLFAGALHGNSRLFRRNLIVSGIAVGIAALFTYARITARGNAAIFWEVLGYLAYIVLCVAIGLFILRGLVCGAYDRSMGRRLRASCLGCALVFFISFSLVYKQKEIATELQRHAVAAGGTSPLAKEIVWELKYWDGLAQLEPSPQKERLIGMVTPSFSPPDGFWEVLLSLPPSPGRLAVITDYAHSLSIGKDNVKWLAVLYDQGDTEALEAVFKENEDAYFDYSLKYIVALGRADILRDVLRRIHGRLTERGQSDALQEAMLQTNGLETVALLLDNGISPNRENYRSALSLAAEYNRIQVARLLLERGADVNADCAVMDAVQHPAMLALLLESGASPLCTRYGETPLHRAAKVDADAESMAFLLGRGIPVDILDPDGRSPLLLAARNGSDTAFNCLVSAGADVSLQDAGGNTALHLAAQNPYLEYSGIKARVHTIMMRLMELRPGLATVRNAEGKTALDYVNDETLLAILRGEKKR